MCMCINMYIDIHANSDFNIHGHKHFSFFCSMQILGNVEMNVEFAFSFGNKGTECAAGWARGFKLVITDSQALHRCIFKLVSLRSVGAFGAADL